MVSLWLCRCEESKETAHRMLHTLLEGRGCSPASIETAPGGKPFLPGGPYFSLSHSGPWALCAVGEEEMGCDVETIRPRRSGLPRYALSDREFQWFSQRGSAWEDFYTLWTLKESLCKCTGRGLDCSPRRLEVPLLQAGEDGIWDGFYFQSYGGEGWRGGCCTRLTPPPTQLLDGKDVL